MSWTSESTRESGAPIVRNAERQAKLPGAAAAHTETWRQVAAARPASRAATRCCARPHAARRFATRQATKQQQRTAATRLRNMLRSVPPHWVRGRYPPGSAVRQRAACQCATSCATTPRSRAARTATRCDARKSTTRQTTVARARAARWQSCRHRSRSVWRRRRRRTTRPSPCAPSASTSGSPCYNTAAVQPQRERAGKGSHNDTLRCA